MELTGAKLQRIRKVNELIKLIASLDRKFFYSKKAYDGTKDSYSEFSFEKNRVCYLDNYSRKKIKQFPNDKYWNGFSNGGTLKGLIKDLVRFIRFGKPIYTGYSCWYWGYEEESVKKIEDKMFEIGFCKLKEVE